MAKVKIVFILQVIVRDAIQRLLRSLLLFPNRGSSRGGDTKLID